MKEHYDYGLYNRDEKELTLFNESTLEGKTRITNFLEDVDVETDELGRLHIKAKEIVYTLTFHRLYEDEWDEEPDEKYIKTRKSWLPWSNKEYRYVNPGWYRLKKREDYNAILTNYTVFYKN